MSRKNYRILIIDDEPEFHQLVREDFQENYEFEGAVSIASLWRKLEADNNFDLILLDLVLDQTKEKKGLSLIPELKVKCPGTPIVIVTSDSHTETVVEAMKLGAKHFLPKDNFDHDYWDKIFLEAIDSRAIDSLKKENKKLKAEVNKAYSFIGDSPRINEIKKTLRAVSEVPDTTVLITGETGVGKEVAARYLHQHGVRKDKPFQAVNLSAVQESLLESELFGHKKGSFTGAISDKEGYFRQANGGILMLDEIGDINSNIQIKLLRFLETKLIRPVGADKDIRLDVQIVVATHKNLKEEVKEGNFRDDLYQRLKTMKVEIPPLRKRLEDLLPIMKHYIGDWQIETLFESKVIDRLYAYDWGGNVRELKSAVEYMQLRKRIKGKTKIDTECLPEEIERFVAGSSNGIPTTAGVESIQVNQSLSSPLTIADLSPNEKRVVFHLDEIEKALQIKNKNKSDAAIMAGFKDADALRYKIKTYYRKHSKLFENYPTILLCYKKNLK